MLKALNQYPKRDRSWHHLKSSTVTLKFNLPSEWTLVGCLPPSTPSFSHQQTPWLSSESTLAPFSAMWFGWDWFHSYSKVASCDSTLNQPVRPISLTLVVAFREGQWPKSGWSGLTKLSSGTFVCPIREVDFPFLLWKESGKEVVPRAVGSHPVTTRAEPVEERSEPRGNQTLRWEPIVKPFEPTQWAVLEASLIPGLPN